MSKYYSYLEVVSMANNLFLVVVKGKVALFDKKFMDWSSLHQLKVGQLQNDILTTYVLILRYEEHCKLKYARLFYSTLPNVKVCLSTSQNARLLNTDYCSMLWRVDPVWVNFYLRVLRTK